MSVKEDQELNSIMSSTPGKRVSSRPLKRRSGGVSPIFEIGGDDEEDDIEEQVASNYCQWTSHNGKLFVPSGRTKTRLVPGVYEIGSSPNIGLYFERIPVKTDDLLRFPDTNSDRVVEEIQKFWTNEAVFKEYGLAYKRGIILWGPAGSGKSSCAQLIMADVVKRGGLVIIFGVPDLFLSGMRTLRTIQPDTPVVVMMEDIDSIIESYHESEVLNILDGVNEVTKCVFMATTNYPDRLGPRIINRPSRFDKRFKIGFPSAESRKLYFEYVIGNADVKKGRKEAKRLGINLKQWVKDTAEMSIAHLKELFIAVVILKDPYDEAINTLKSMKEEIDDKEYGKFGFDSEQIPNEDVDNIVDWD
jgi:ATPase family associated with various cellular activities (AAA)